MTEEHRRATYAATDALFARLAAHGVTDVVLSPGSRSTPLAVVAAARADLRTHVVLDERSAGFVALGMATVSDRPVALACTSGTATANYLPAVVEANRGRVPLIVLTSDRPLGFLERDEPQTIDQVDLYARQVRWSADLAEPDAGAYVEAAQQAVAQAVRPKAGPVHLNVRFDKPLEPPPAWAPSARFDPATIVGGLRETPDATETLASFLAEHERGVVVAGSARLAPGEIQHVVDVAAAVGWPVIADPLSGGRALGRPEVVSTGELLLRDPGFVASHRPDAVLRVAGTPTGRATLAWLSALDVPTLIVDPDERWAARGPTVLRAQVGALFTSVDPPRRDGWLATWQEAEQQAASRRRDEVSSNPATEPAMFRAALDAAAGPVWVASSMPVRHLDVMTPNGHRSPVFANRGANGIDGTIGSAAGAALAAGERVTVLLGDLAFLHDVGSLTTALESGAELTLVVFDNGGGAIFDMLPIAEDDDVPFERLFTTPQHRDLVAVARGFGATARSVESGDLGEAVASPSAAVNVLVVSTDREELFRSYERMVGA